MRHFFTLLLIIGVILLSTQAHSLSVNRLNGGLSVTYVDFSVPGKLVPLELIRTYNSITGLNEAKGWKGAFGWGWTNDFETTLTVTPERHVILRDGSTGNNVVFAPQREDPRVKRDFFRQIKKAYFEDKLGKSLKASELEKYKLPADIRTRLEADATYRATLASRLGVKGEIPKGQVLVSSKYGYQTMEFKNRFWVRNRNGILQYFDLDGRLVRQANRNGFHIDYRYSPNNKMQLSTIELQDRTAVLKLRWRNGKIFEVTDNLGKRATYKYDKKDNLVRVTDSLGQTYRYRYDNKRFPHAMTKIDYVTENAKGKKVFRSLGYDKNGLLVYHRGKDGVAVRYKYGRSSGDPQNSFWTETVWEGAREIYEPTRIREEFSLKKRAGGSKYLYKLATKKFYQLTKKKTKEMVQTTIFTACCGKPSQIIKNGAITKFKYYPNGLLKEKVSPKGDIRLEYDPQWMKVSKVVQNGNTSAYRYDNRGNLVYAKREGQEVSLKYDRLGRIQEMWTGKKKKKKNLLTFRYSDKGKPTVIRKVAVGTLHISYDTSGRILRTDALLPQSKRKPSAMEAQRIVSDVMGSFHRFLEVIRPAAQGNDAVLTEGL